MIATHNLIDYRMMITGQRFESLCSYIADSRRMLFIVIIQISHSPIDYIMMEFYGAGFSNQMFLHHRRMRGHGTFDVAFNNCELHSPRPPAIYNHLNN
jgi:hypothetical protein